ncbi:hypothetical protein ACFL0L_03265 [Patescibacteria group bacterium]
MNAVTKGFISVIASNYKWFAIGTLIIVLGVGYVLVVGPKIQELQEVGIEGQKDRELTLETLKEEKSQLQSAKERFDKISSEELELVRLALPTEKDIPNLFVEIPSFIESKGLLMTSLDISETDLFFGEGEQPRATIHRLDISVGVDGLESYDLFKDFLVYVEDNLRLLDINSITYIPDAGSYVFTLTTYYTSAVSPVM